MPVISIMPLSLPPTKTSCFFLRDFSSGSGGRGKASGRGRGKGDGKGRGKAATGTLDTARLREGWMEDGVFHLSKNQL